MTLAWIHRGEFAASFQHLTPDEIKQAEAQGWGEMAEGKSASKLTYPDKSAHPESDAFFRQRNEQLYGTREMRATHSRTGAGTPVPPAEAAPSFEPAAPPPSDAPADLTAPPTPSSNRRRTKG